MINIELLPIESLDLTSIDLPQNYKIDNVNVFYSEVEEEDMFMWNESNSIYILLTQAEKLGLIEKCPENFGDPIIIDELDFHYDEQDDILAYFEINRHGFVIREYKDGFILIVQNGIKDLKNDEYQRQGMKPYFIYWFNPESGEPSFESGHLAYIEQASSELDALEQWHVHLNGYYSSGDFLRNSTFHAVCAL